MHKQAFKHVDIGEQFYEKEFERTTLTYLERVFSSKKRQHSDDNSFSLNMCNIHFRLTPL